MHSYKSRPSIIFLALLLAFQTANSSPITSHKTSPRTGTGTIACLIDGKQVSLPIQGFREISLDFYAKGANDGILFANGDDKSEGFQFKIKKSGTSAINHTGTGNAGCIINYYNTEGVTFTGKDVTVIVKSYSSHHVAGTFSGKLANVYFASGAAFPNVKGAKVAKNYPPFIQITNGKFDITQ